MTQRTPAVRAPAASASGLVNAIRSPGGWPARRAFGVAHVVERRAASSSASVSVRAPGPGPRRWRAARRRAGEQAGVGEERAGGARRTIGDLRVVVGTLCTLRTGGPRRQGRGPGPGIPASRPAGTCAPGGSGRRGAAAGATSTAPGGPHVHQLRPRRDRSADKLPASPCSSRCSASPVRRSPGTCRPAASGSASRSRSPRSRRDPRPRRRRPHGPPDGHGRDRAGRVEILFRRPGPSRGDALPQPARARVRSPP